MEQPKEILPKGTRVRIHDEVEQFLMLSGPRPGGVEGEVVGVVPGMGGDVYFVNHGNDVSLYCFDEFELIVPRVERLAVGTCIRTNEMLAADRPLCGTRSPACEGTVRFVMDSPNGVVYTVDHGGYSAEYHRDEFELVPTTKDLADLLFDLERLRPAAVAEILGDDNLERLTARANAAASLFGEARPYAEQDAAGREAWTACAMLAALVLLRAVALTKAPV